MSHITTCKQCGKQFTAQRKSATYCSDSCRVRACRSRALECWYCGDVATSRDHVIPHAATGLNNRRYEGVELIECCANCNSILGANLFNTLAERVEFLAKRFCAKHKLNRPHIEWSEDDLNELTGNLRQYVRAKEIEWAKNQSRYLHMTLRHAVLVDIDRSRA
jgi:hypothetical protein